jgi:hypothetical protein
MEGLYEHHKKNMHIAISSVCTGFSHSPSNIEHIKETLSFQVVTTGKMQIIYDGQNHCGLVKTHRR